MDNKDKDKDKDKDKELASELLSVYEKHDRGGLFLFIGKDEKFKMMGTPDFPSGPEDFEMFVVDLFKEIIQNIESKKTKKTNVFYKQGKIN